ncbi:hypothetical protein GNI_173170 [Gregarina niphandrodes]|uniref:Uncharacterized protein n=1 Tax=Gregarina niphandrodes TaxID=110365 RepID=A0A023AXN7_GRENI|nr:hypothetical protein GNI_173170 [Gregarina niphandrodes]EZG43406.1 hypothetical protein GNI_173170 [Gregarina niphandrodes]|eukprot:XP_011133364.1 hypothetical protein GNI_173170 [Gregarina niphandrodes]
MRELREYLQDVDPQNEFFEVSDRICQESVGRTMLELRKILKKTRGLDSESLEVTDCSPLTRAQVDELRGSLSKEWLSMLDKLCVQSGGLIAETSPGGKSMGLGGLAALMLCRRAGSEASGAPLQTRGEVLGEALGLNAAITMTDNKTASSLSLSGLVSKVIENTTNLIYDTSTSAHYNATSVSSIAGNFSTGVDVTTTTEALQKTTKGDGTITPSESSPFHMAASSDSSLLDLVSRVASKASERIFENPSTPRYDAPTGNAAFDDLSTEIAVSITTEALLNGTMIGDGSTRMEAPFSKNASGVPRSTGAHYTPFRSDIFPHRQDPRKGPDTSTTVASRVRPLRTRRKRPVSNKTSDVPGSAPVHYTPFEPAVFRQHDRDPRQWSETSMTMASRMPGSTAAYYTPSKPGAFRQHDRDPRQGLSIELINKFSRFKKTMALAELDQLWTVCPSTCHKVVKPGFDRYPCDGGSGVMRCRGTTLQGDSACYRFGGPWGYDFFAVRNAITTYLGRGKCKVSCDGPEQGFRNLWEQTEKNLPGIPGYPEGNFLKYTAEPSVANMSDFKVMLDTSYPITRECSGWCVRCPGLVKNCLCAFTKISCLATARRDGSPQRIDLVGYKTRTHDLINLLTLFNTKDEDLYNAHNCKVECRKMPPDIDAASEAGVEMQFIETEPADDGSPLKETLSRRELAALQAEGCSVLTNGWKRVESIGEVPCPGNDGLLKCWYSSFATRGLCNRNGMLGLCVPFEPSCHRFGPQWADAYAVLDAGKRYLPGLKHCSVFCYPNEITSNRLWEEARTYLRHAPGYERLWPSYNELSELPHFRDAITVQHPTQKRDVLDCDPDNCTVTSDRVCRIARVSCEIEQSGSQESRSAESIKFNTRLQDAFRTLSIPNANAKDNKRFKNKKCTFECYGELWPCYQLRPSKKKRPPRGGMFFRCFGQHSNRELNCL